MESFDTTLVDVKPVLNYKNGLRKRETTQKIILYGVISFILLSLVILTFKYISTTSKMTSTINEISSRLDKAMDQLTAIKQSLNDKEYDSNYGHLKELFDN